MDLFPCSEPNESNISWKGKSHSVRYVNESSYCLRPWQGSTSAKLFNYFSPGIISWSVNMKSFRLHQRRMSFGCLTLEFRQLISKFSQRTCVFMWECMLGVVGDLWWVVCVCVFPGGDETLSLTRCCSVKVKPYRMSGMMTRTERFHLIPPFPLFPSVPPICLLHLRLRPAHSRDKTDIYRPSPRVCIKTLCGCVSVRVCV